MSSSGSLTRLFGVSPKAFRNWPWNKRAPASQSKELADYPPTRDSDVPISDAQQMARARYDEILGQKTEQGNWKAIRWETSSLTRLTSPTTVRFPKAIL